MDKKKINYKRRNFINFTLKSSFFFGLFFLVNIKKNDLPKKKLHWILSINDS